MPGRTTLRARLPPQNPPPTPIDPNPTSTQVGVNVPVYLLARCRTSASASHDPKRTPHPCSHSNELQFRFSSHCIGTTGSMWSDPHPTSHPTIHLQVGVNVPVYLPRAVLDMQHYYTITPLHDTPTATLQTTPRARLASHSPTTVSHNLSGVREGAGHARLPLTTQTAHSTHGAMPKLISNACISTRHLRDGFKVERPSTPHLAFCPSICRRS